jgi:Na+-driven multidrug efflux pump
MMDDQITTSRVIQHGSRISGSWENAVMIMILGAPLIGMNVVTSILFHALGKARPVFLLSISRQLLFLIPLVILLLHLYGLYGVWVTYPISDFLAFMLSGFLLFRVYRIFKEHKDSSKIGAGS